MPGLVRMFARIAEHHRKKAVSANNAVFKNSSVSFFESMV